MRGGGEGKGREESGLSAFFPFFLSFFLSLFLIFSASVSKSKKRILSRRIQKKEGGPFNKQQITIF